MRRWRAVMSREDRGEGPLTGRWVGHYEQRDQRRGLVADLRQEGERLTGTMRDEKTEFETTVWEMAAECGLPPGADEQIIAALRKQFPESRGTPIRALMTLPAESQLSGQVRGRRVTFRKIYRGEAFSGYRVGEERVGVSVAGHAVHYRGELNVRGDLLEGSWWIEADLKRGMRRTEGAFELRRVEG